MKTPLHSIRWRLQAWHGLILFAVILGFCVTAYQLVSTNQYRRAGRSVIHAERMLMGALIHQRESERQEGPPPHPEDMIAAMRRGEVKLPAEVEAQFSGAEPGFLYFRIWDADGTVVLESENAPADLVPMDSAQAAFEEGMRTTDTRREIVRGSPRGIQSVVGRDMTPELADMERFAWSLAGAGLAVWVLGLLGGWWLAGRAIKPISEISRAAARIAEGNLEERISTAGDSELDDLARVLNQTFERLHATFERQRQFTADASHELRTPVTILLSETQRILRRERSAGEYRDALITCQESAQRMRNLTESLLLLARQESTALQREPRDLAELLAEAVKHLSPLAKEHGVEVLPRLAPAPALVDPTAIAILFNNLISNAVQHNRAGGCVWVECGLEGGDAVVTVRDDGPGIGEEDLPHVFERFYRADKARGGQGGHTGLGLAIAQVVAERHGGVLRVSSTPGVGAAFTLHLPAAKVPAMV